MGMVSSFFPYILGGFGVAVIVSGIRIVRPVEKMLVERWGKFKKLEDSGFKYVIPIADKSIMVNITENMVDIRPQTVITKDKLNAVVDAVVYYKINDIKKAIYQVDHYEEQLISLSRTTLRSVIGTMTLAQANEERAEINNKVEKVLDKETETYGVEVLRVELQKIEPPQDVQNAMNEVVKAEQKKIAALDTANALETEADGMRRAEIKKAEGNKQASILKAEGQAKAFDLIEKSFKGRSQKLEQLRVTQASLENNTKILVTEKGIKPSIILGDIPIKK